MAAEAEVLVEAKQFMCQDLKEFTKSKEKSPFFCWNFLEPY